MELNIPRVAVVGSGYWGKNLSRNSHSLGTLAGICNKDPRILQNLQPMYDGVVTFRRFDDLLDGSGLSVDAIAIATPAGSHYELTKKALLGGKLVFVEKPLALTVPDGNQNKLVPLLLYLCSQTLHQFQSLLDSCHFVSLAD